MPRSVRIVALSPVEPDVPAVVRLLNHTAMRAEWSDPDDLNPLRRNARQIRGYRSWCSLRRMAVNANSGISAEHIHAADKLREDVDLTRYGLTGNREPFQFIDHVIAPRSGPSQAEQARVAAARSVWRVLRIFTLDQQRMLAVVVLHNHTVQDWVRMREAETDRRIDRNVEKGRLLGILDLLVQHLGTEVDEELRLGRRLAV